MKVELPIDADSARATRAQTRWMVVDDDEGVRNFIASVLESLGHAGVEKFRCATDALAAFAARPEEFQFVVTDLEMPGMNGIELCRRLLSISPGLKVVLATGNSAANVAGARSCGFYGLLNKPFAAAELHRLAEKAGVGPEPIFSNR